MKTIIYIRTSTTEQTPEIQLKDCLSINKYGAYDIIKDEQSAWKDNKERNGFNELINLISKRQIDNLIVWDLDRIYRNRKKLIEFFELCKHYNCQIHSFRQAWLEDLNKIPKPFNEMMHNLMLQIMGWLAEEESTKKSERVKLAVRKNNGITESYKGNRWGRKALTLQKKDEIIELRKSGNSIRQIANKLNLSSGVVHKYIVNFHEQKDSQNKQFIN